MVYNFKCIGLSFSEGISKKSGNSYRIMHFYGVGNFSEFECNSSDVSGHKSVDISIFGNDIDDLIPEGFEIDKTYKFNCKGYGYDLIRSISKVD